MKLFSKLKITAITFLQRVYITLQLYGENGLANHAAACAYGFLLSVAPMLLLIAFFIFFTLESSPGAISAMINTIPFLGSIFDEQWLSNDFFSFSRPSFPGIISVLSIIWAGRILALAIQRGLKIVFPAEKKRNPVKNTLITLAIEVSVIIFVLVIIISSRTAMRFYTLLDYTPRFSVIEFIMSHFGSQVSYITLLGLAAYFVYILVPANPPRKISALWGAFFCTLAYFCTVLVLGIILNRARYNFLYGTFGNLIIILINVYFFFTFFFIGAQLAFIRDYFDAYLFIKLRQNRKKAEAKYKAGSSFNRFRYSYLMYKFLYPVESSADKYLRRYEKGGIIFSHEDTEKFAGYIFYLLEGEVEILISSGGEGFAGILKADSFFGEMGHLLSESRNTAVRAKTDVYIFAMSSSLFDDVIKYDTNLDKTLIEYMSNRIKNANKAISTAVYP